MRCSGGNVSHLCHRVFRFRYEIYVEEMKRAQWLRNTGVPGSFLTTVAFSLLFGMAVRLGGLPPFLLTWEIVVGVLTAQVIVGMAGPAMSVVRLQRLQPEEAFRGRAELKATPKPFSDFIS